MSIVRRLRQNDRIEQLETRVVMQAYEIGALHTENKRLQALLAEKGIEF